MTSNANNTQVIQIIPKLYIIRKSGRVFRHRMFRHKIAETDVSAHSDRTSTIAETDVSAQCAETVFGRNIRLPD